MSEEIVTLTKEKVAEIFHKRLGMSAKDGKEALEIILEQLKAELEKTKDVKISGFGKWSVKMKNTRPGRNPHTGGRIEIAARSVVVFHPSDKLRSAVNNSK